MRFPIVGWTVALVCLLPTSAFSADLCGFQARVESPALPQGSQNVVYCRVAGKDFIDGDIELPPAPKRTEPFAEYGAVSNRKSALWPSGRVAYAINPSLRNPERVLRAIAHWEGNTSIRIRPRTSETDYVEFVPGTGCSSSIGRVGGRQTISLALGCGTGAIIHELGHALGLWHEQSRADRDEYVTIHWENIADAHKFNFSKFDSTGKLQGSYDYHSIMHYEPDAFSKNGLPTITAVGDATIPKWSHDYLSRGDISSIESLYESSR